MYMFPTFVNGPIDEQKLLQMSGGLLQDGLPKGASRRQCRLFESLQLRHTALESIVSAYQGSGKSMPLKMGRYYANLERAVGAYRSIQILTPSA